MVRVEAPRRISTGGQLTSGSAPAAVCSSFAEEVLEKIPPKMPTQAAGGAGGGLGGGGEATWQWSRRRSSRRP